MQLFQDKDGLRTRIRHALQSFTVKPTRHQRKATSRGHHAIVCAIERVENRCLLAGVVGMSLSSGGNLTLTGDAANNEVEVGVFNSDFGIVRGQNGTLIDLDGFPALMHLFPLEVIETEVGTFPALAGNLTINTNDGNDTVEIFGTNGPLSPFVIEGRLDVDLGAGSDTFEQSVSYVGGNARIRGGNGGFGDYIQIDEAFLFGDTLIHTGASGNAIDQIVIDQGNFTTLEARGASGVTEVSFHDSSAGELEILTGSGDDQIFVSESLVWSDVRINSGSSSSESPGDYVRLGSSAVVGDLRIDGRQGRQTIEFLPTAIGDDMQVGGNTLISTGGGRDVVRVDNEEPVRFYGNVRVRTGGGNDEVDIQADAEFDGNLSISLGGGSDTLLFSSMVTVAGNGQLTGGGGTDFLSASYEFATWLSGLPTVAFEEFI